MTNLEPPQLRRVVLQYLESLKNAGVQQLPRCRQPLKPHVETPSVQSVPSQPVIVEQLPELPAESGNERTESITEQGKESAVARRVPSDAAVESSEAASLYDYSDLPRISGRKRQQALDVIGAEVADCRQCAELASTRTQTVFGVGNPSARLVFLGEATGADEDRQGEPFVGRAGQLLTKIIEACSLHREDVYILNILKCRPPGNRNPAPDEAAHCSDYLRRQLGIIRPEFICCLGAVAAQNLLQTTVTIGRLRGTFHPLGDSKVIATYHPAYLLRNPSAKKSNLGRHETPDARNGN